MKNNKKGFTLAELLIVIAIIAVLIAIAIPVFSGQLENARLQADHANLRSAYAIIQTANLIDEDSAFGITVGTATKLTYCTDGTFKSGTAANPVKFQGTTHTGTATTNAKPGCAECVVNCSGINGSTTHNLFAVKTTDSTTSATSWHLSYDGTAAIS